MKILVTGATGFIGSHLVPALLDRGVSVIATSRTPERAEAMPWFRDVEYHPLDTARPPRDPFASLGSPDRMIHLAWSGLPNYKDDFHLTENLPADKRFLTAMLDGGLKHLLVTGTCFEYGMQEGELREDTPTRPDNPYGQAKDKLRTALEDHVRDTDITFQWARLFYMYGPGQGERSLFAQLGKALERNEPVFRMSGGEQIRDFLPVETLAAHLADICLQKAVSGVINVCSGRSVTLRELVEEYLRDRGASIELELGYYPYPDYEPFRFWGNTEKLDSALSGREK